MVVAALVSLGTWQVHRLSWKRALIARVESRVHAAPVSPPGPAAWLDLKADKDEYRPVTVTGIFVNDRATAVQAATVLGSGVWIVTPFRTDDGWTVLVNRGFVSTDRRERGTPPLRQVADRTTISGLLRISEPNGAFLQTNDPAANRWVSRDVAAIAAARDVGTVAPYFIDAGASPTGDDGPVGGLTVVAFANNHLLYAIIWYGLAALLAGAGIWSVLPRKRQTS